MKRARAIALMATGFLLLIAGGAMGAQPEELNTIRKGDTVPAFTGRNLAGEEVDVGAVIGEKVVVLAFWSIYCKPCVEEISSLIRIQEDFGDRDLEVIGINADSELGVGRIRKFIDRFEEFEKKKINYRIIFDEGNKISSLLGVGFLPTVLSVNKSGKVEKMFVGFEEKSEEEILAGIRSLLPSEGEAAAPESDSQLFSVGAVVPLCGFYGPDGWMGSFSGNHDLELELEKAAEMARLKATKLVLKEALLSLGLTLAEDPEKESCFRPYGVYLMDDPMEIKDNLTNLINQLPINQLVKVQDVQEDFLGTEYRVIEKATVNMTDLRDALDSLGYRLTPKTLSFSIINVKKLDQVKFEKLLLQQSKYIGYFSFPTYTIFTSPETFTEEMEKMDLEGLKLFVEEILEDRIELEVWR